MQPDDPKRFRVIVQGIFRQPTAGDSEVVALEAGDEAEEGPLGFIFHGNNPADNW
jgi:hypothetical protein